MFVYQNASNIEYYEESRQVGKDYHKYAMNPYREVAKIETNPNRPRPLPVKRKT